MRRELAEKSRKKRAERGEEWQLTSMSNSPNIIFAKLSWKSLNTGNVVVLHLSKRNVPFLYLVHYVEEVSEKGALNSLKSIRTI